VKNKVLMRRENVVINFGYEQEWKLLIKCIEQCTIFGFLLTNKKKMKILGPKTEFVSCEVEKKIRNIMLSSKKYILPGV
jgi:hypothetical protein